ncbi:hypothetical protein KH5H1_20750 [Corallococcus caeni]|uniref:Uncharacterized protein n=1 Tax=Corallococcus caeni TaxID=3082388 RepID=A0ABQ6QT92_9BACT|nr:hypothetical protein KH5H1_20750 [Corallococcus sp. KH5-1]GMU07240.1 hypothetical protein ASNO1_34930 [Corallococcus sp. NO1]
MPESDWLESPWLELPESDAPAALNPAEGVRHPTASTSIDAVTTRFHEDFVRIHPPRKGATGPGANRLPMP